MNQSTIHYTLVQLNQQSREILDELRSESCRMEKVRKLLDQRTPIIKKLLAQPNAVQQGGATERKNSTIEALFDSYEKLEVEIHDQLKRIVAERRKILADATKQRKAEDGYHLLDKPDISYY